MKYQDDNFYIEKVLNGDSSAYAALVDKHKNLVFSIALKVLNSREDAEEIAQDAFIKAFHSLKSFERKSKFSTWLYRIVYNAAISHTRKRVLETIPMDNYVIYNYSEESMRPGVDRAAHGVGRAGEPGHVVLQRRCQAGRGDLGVLRHPGAVPEEVDDLADALDREVGRGEADAGEDAGHHAAALAGLRLGLGHRLLV